MSSRTSAGGSKERWCGRSVAARAGPALRPDEHLPVIEQRNRLQTIAARARRSAAGYRPCGSGSRGSKAAATLPADRDTVRPVWYPRTVLIRRLPDGDLRLKGSYAAERSRHSADRSPRAVRRASGQDRCSPRSARSRSPRSRKRAQRRDVALTGFENRTQLAGGQSLNPSTIAVAPRERVEREVQLAEHARRQRASHCSSLRSVSVRARTTRLAPGLAVRAALACSATR